MSSLFFKTMNCELPGISLKTLSNLPSDLITRIIVKKKLSFGKRNNIKSSFFCPHRPMSKRTVCYMNPLLSFTVCFSLFPLSSASMHHITYVCGNAICTYASRQFNIDIIKTGTHLLASTRTSASNFRTTDTSVQYKHFLRQYNLNICRKTSQNIV